MNNSFFSEKVLRAGRQIKDDNDNISMREAWLLLKALNTRQDG